MLNIHERNMEIYKSYLNGARQRTLAYKYNVCHTRIHQIIRRMKLVTTDLNRLNNPQSEWDKIEAMFYPDRRILTCLKEENVKTIQDIHDLLERIDNGYGIPNIGAKSVKIMRKVLADHEAG